MSQAWAENVTRDQSSPEFALVVSGWPTIYTVSASYSVGAGDADLSTSNGFDPATKPYASISRASRSSLRRRPEDGSTEVGFALARLVDRLEGGARELSRLLCSDRPTAGLPPAVLSEAVTASETTLDVDSLNNFNVDGSGVAFIGSECIRYSVATDAFGAPQLIGCDRGYRLTVAASHSEGVVVTTDPPSIYCRRALLYKGFRQLDIAEWAPEFVGVITGAEKVGPAVELTIAEPLWLADLGGRQLLLQDCLAHRATINKPGGYALDGVGDPNETPAWEVITVDVTNPSTIGNGHYLLNFYGEWAGIRSAEEAT